MEKQNEEKKETVISTEKAMSVVTKRDELVQLAGLKKEIDNKKELSKAFIDDEAILDAIESALAEVSPEQLELMSNDDIEKIYTNPETGEPLGLSIKGMKEKDFFEFKKDFARLIVMGNESDRAYDEAEKEFAAIMEEMDEYGKEYMDQYKNSIDVMRKDLEDRISKETDEKEAARLRGILDSMDVCKGLHKIGDDIRTRNIDNLLNDFKRDDIVRVTYIKYREVSEKQLGLYSSDFAKFTGFEKKFLENKYHVLENLFIFIIMRTVRHYNKPTATNEGIFLSMLATSMNEMVKGKADQEDAKKLLDEVRYILDAVYED